MREGLLARPGPYSAVKKFHVPLPSTSRRFQGRGRKTNGQTDKRELKIGRSGEHGGARIADRDQLRRRPHAGKLPTNIKVISRVHA